MATLKTEVYVGAGPAPLTLILIQEVELFVVTIWPQVSLLSSLYHPSLWP